MAGTAKGNRDAGSGWRLIATAALTLVATITSGKDMPKQRNFDNVVTWSKTGRTSGCA
jgi:hypothetical protein